MKAYFSHDEGARNDPKLVEVLMALGHEGKSVYWDLVEMLYEQGGYLMLAQCKGYAFALRTDCSLILSLVNDFGLFVNDGERFWSETALRRLEQRNAKSTKAKESAAKRWAVSERNANALPPQSEGNAIKGKEIKGNESKEDTLPLVEVAASAAEPVQEKKIEPTPLTESPTIAPQTEGGAAPLKATKGGKPLLTGPLADLLNTGGLAARVQTMKQPFTQAEADNLVTKYGLDNARHIVQQMANYAKLTNNLSASLTAQNWLDKRQKETGTNANAQRNAVYSRPLSPAAQALHVPTGITDYGSLN